MAPYVRNAFLAANGIALVIFMLYPWPRRAWSARASWTP